MCGIVAASAKRAVDEILISGLHALEYRGYDSAGLVLQGTSGQRRVRTAGKVGDLESLYRRDAVSGHCGLGHTRWATHGAPTDENAHPHLAADHVAVVHNGIVENHASLREELLARGRQATSETDTELVALLLAETMDEGQDLYGALRAVIGRLEGSFALAAVSEREPGVIAGARRGSPLVLGVGFGEHFLASDIHPLVAVTNRFVYLQDGDCVKLDQHGYEIRDATGQPVQRAIHEADFDAEAIDRGQYRHFMKKEIFEQPEAVARTLEEGLRGSAPLAGLLGAAGERLLERARGVHIVACGTSFHAGMVARYLMEQLAGLPCSVEVASEYRYRQPVVPENTLFVTISQSGETADTLAALRHANQSGYLGTIGICNVAQSSLVREADVTLLTRAGPEIGVASTKAFTTQLVALELLVLAIARNQGLPGSEVEAAVDKLRNLPELLRRALEQDRAVASLARGLVEKHHALFLGRGSHYPIALEGALKLKEISYIHAEAYPAGELKHGPLALVDSDMPVIAVAPNDALIEKLASNLEEVRARGGELLCITDRAAAGTVRPHHGRVLELDAGGELTSPIVLTVPLQLLAYHVAVARGTDVDQPRNLAKSVTVE